MTSIWSCFISKIKSGTRHESILFTFGLSVLVAGALAWTFQFDLHFHSNILANVTANWKTRGPTKPNNKIIYTMNHHGNWVISHYYSELCYCDCPISWSCRIHWLHLCRGVRPPPNECPGYDTKQSDGEVPAVLELWGMRSIPSLPSPPGPLWPGVVAPDRALSMG